MKTDEDIYKEIKSGAFRVYFCGPMNSPSRYRFWARVNKDGPVHPVCGQCWQWDCAEDRYGVIQINGEGVQAHRYSWTLHNGEVPNDLWVLHKCDNKGCVNPAHLFLGTPQDNAVDMTDKGRHVYCKGESNPDHRLTDEQVLEIRRRHPKDARKRDKLNGTKALSKEFKVSTVTIKKIVYDLAWTHV